MSESIFVTELNDGKAHLTKFLVLSEDLGEFKVSKPESLIGSPSEYMFSGTITKYIWNWFRTGTEAKERLLKLAEKHRDGCRKEYLFAERQVLKLRQCDLEQGEQDNDQPPA